MRSSIHDDSCLAIVELVLLVQDQVRARSTMMRSFASSPVCSQGINIGRYGIGWTTVPLFSNGNLAGTFECWCLVSHLTAVVGVADAATQDISVPQTTSSRFGAKWGLVGSLSRVEASSFWFVSGGRSGVDFGLCHCLRVGSCGYPHNPGLMVGTRIASCAHVRGPQIGLEAPSAGECPGALVFYCTHLDTRCVIASVELRTNVSSLHTLQTPLPCAPGAGERVLWQQVRP